jgi:hypothetical protein
MLEINAGNKCGKQMRVKKIRRISPNFTSSKHNLSLNGGSIRIFSRNYRWNIWVKKAPLK